MHVTPAFVREQYEWTRERAPVVVALVDVVRERLGERFDATVPGIEPADYRSAVDAVFADGDRAVNAAALIGLLREIDVAEDYPGFVVDELLGRELAALVAGDQPLRLLAEATFHYADVHVDAGDTTRERGDEEAAGVDDLDAALAAGVQTRLPGWPWRERESPFAVEP